MSFGAPSALSPNTVLPPDRGSFPLDHDGECKSKMLEYMNCMKKNKNNNKMCRELSMKYLRCRMERGLMHPDKMTNLGFKDILPSSEKSDHGNQTVNKTDNSNVNTKSNSNIREGGLKKDKSGEDNKVNS